VRNFQIERRKGRGVIRISGLGGGRESWECLEAAMQNGWLGAGLGGSFGETAPEPISWQISIQLNSVARTIWLHGPKVPSKEMARLAPLFHF